MRPCAVATRSAGHASPARTNSAWTTSLPAKIEERLAQAEPEQLQGWAEKTLFAQSIEEVFED
jgi:hypothetical protein